MKHSSLYSDEEFPKYANYMYAHAHGVYVTFNTYQYVIMMYQKDFGLVGM